MRQLASPARGARAGSRRSTADDGGWRRSGSADGSGRPAYYDDAGEEAGALLYARDELVERCASRAPLGAVQA